MVKYILKRLLLAVLILFGVSVILYFIIRLMPLDYFTGKFATQMANGGMTQEDLDRILAIYGLNDNSFLGILKGYWSWLTNFLKGNMGISFQYEREVSEVIKERMGISFSISLVSLILELFIAIPLGIKCATNQYGKFDYTVTVICMVAMAFPSFFLGNIFIKWFAVDLGWFETGGLNSSSLPTTATGIEVFGDMIWHLVLPILVMVILDIGSLMRYTRTNTLEVLNADYIRTARAKGLSEGKVVYKHVFRNSLIPLITVLASTLPMLFGGAMITETVFDIPGIGQAAYNALKVGDIPLAMGYNMFIAVLTVIGTLLADIMYAVVDPRVKLK
ncbi:MAG: ABC transporter permease [Clostridia bacterium]|nr:ABC transporter permease [Clostridia bacterium]MDE7265181.1 ABC transporter permease [Clostridia bacterium]